MERRKDARRGWSESWSSIQGSIGVAFSFELLRRLTRDLDERPGLAELVLRAARVVPEVAVGDAPQDEGVAEAVLLHQPVLVRVEQHRVAVPLHLKHIRTEIL